MAARRIVGAELIHQHLGQGPGLRSRFLGVLKQERGDQLVERLRVDPAVLIGGDLHLKGRRVPWQLLPDRDREPEIKKLVEHATVGGLVQDRRGEGLPECGTVEQVDVHHRRRGVDRFTGPDWDALAAQRIDEVHEMAGKPARRLLDCRAVAHGSRLPICLCGLRLS